MTGRTVIFAPKPPVVAWGIFYIRLLFLISHNTKPIIIKKIIIEQLKLKFQWIILDRRPKISTISIA